MKLTLHKTVEICQEWWDWLAEHGECDNKADWPKLKEYEKYGTGTRYHPICNNCPCCEYVKQITEGARGCILFLCPLWPLWPQPFGRNTMGVDAENHGCEHRSSPYQKWKVTKRASTRSRYARQIADACSVLLATMEAE